MATLDGLDPGPPEPPLVADPQATHETHQWGHSRSLLGCRIDPRGKYVVTGAQGNTLQRWDTASGQKVELAGHDSWVRALGFTRDGQTLLSGGYDGAVLWWSIRDERPQVLRRIEAHDGWVRALAVSPDQTLLATCGNDNLVKLWDMQSGAPVKSLAGHERHVYNVLFHPGGRQLVSADLMGVIHAWDLASGEIIRTYSGEALHGYDKTFWADIGGARGMSFSADGTRFACAGITKVTNAFAGQGNALVVSYGWEKEEPVAQHQLKGNFRGVAWQVIHHPQGYLIALLSGHGGGMLAFFRPDGEEEFHKVKLSSQCHDFDLAADGVTLAVAHYDSKLRLYRMVSKLGG